MIPVFLVSGLVLLWLGGEFFIRGSVAVAQRLNVSQLMIGLTLVGFGTSLPELVTSVTAALTGAPGLAVGNVVGSNIANILLILGIGAMLRPVVCRPDAFTRDVTALALATALATGLIVYGQVERWHGAILLGSLIAYIFFVYRHERRDPGPAGRVLAGEAQVAEPASDSVLVASVLVIAGLTGIAGGAWLLVTGATQLAVFWEVSGTFIGLTIVALGTSLPELVVTVVASLRGRADVALGNVIGSNMFNSLAILGATSVVTPIAVPSNLRAFDLTVMVAATLLLIMTAATQMRVRQSEGALFVGAYVGYTILRTSFAL